MKQVPLEFYPASNEPEGGRRLQFFAIDGVEEEPKLCVGVYLARGLGYFRDDLQMDKPEYPSCRVKAWAYLPNAKEIIE
jgi:hypothetical protein